MADGMTEEQVKQLKKLNARVTAAFNYLDECKEAARAAREAADQCVTDLRTFIANIDQGELNLVPPKKG